MSAPALFEKWTSGMIDAVAFAVYAVVYAVYFFPWRLVKKPVTQAAPISAQ